VREQYGDLLALAFQDTTGGEDFLGQVERSIGQGCRLGVWVQCRDRRYGGRGSNSGLGLPPPHQPPAAFIDNVGMGKEEIFFQVFQGRVIQVELPFERAIGNTLTAPEQVNDLIQHRIKVHPSPLTRQAWRVPSVDGASYGTKREHCQPDTLQSKSSTRMSGRVQRGKILCFLMKKQADIAGDTTAHNPSVTPPDRQPYPYDLTCPQGASTVVESGRIPAW